MAKSKRHHQDFPAGPVVKTSPASAGSMDSIPGWGVKFPHASQQEEQQQNQQSEQNEQQMDKETAEQILQALEQDEQETQEKLQRQQGKKRRVEKEW